MSERWLIFDTETIDAYNRLDVFDIGFVVATKDEILHKERLIIKEVYENTELFKEAFYYDKNIEFYESLDKKEFKNVIDIRKTMNRLIKEFNVTKIAAFNVKFDLRALNFTFGKYLVQAKKISKDKLSKAGIDVIDIVDLFFANTDIKDYAKFCLVNNYVTEKGNIMSNAETVYRYIKGNIDIKEEHTGLEDAEIEYEMVKHIISKEKHDLNKKVGQAWRYIKKHK